MHFQISEENVASKDDLCHVSEGAKKESEKVDPPTDQVTMR
jgi:hypothetical protein